MKHDAASRALLLAAMRVPELKAPQGRSVLLL
jgi:hypothetical protein